MSELPEFLFEERLCEYACKLLIGGDISESTKFLEQHAHEYSDNRALYVLFEHVKLDLQTDIKHLCCHNEGVVLLVRNSRVSK